MVACALIMLEQKQKRRKKQKQRQTQHGELVNAPFVYGWRRRVFFSVHFICTRHRMTTRQLPRRAHNLYFIFSHLFIQNNRVHCGAVTNCGDTLLCCSNDINTVTTKMSIKTHKFHGKTYGFAKRTDSV